MHKTQRSILILILIAAATTACGGKPTKRDFATTESIVIRAPIKVVWDFTTNLKNWKDSNPDHLGTVVLSERRDFHSGLRFRDREKVGGYLGEKLGRFYDVVPGRSWKWECDARYKNSLGWTLIRIQEGGVFSLKPTKEGVLVSHTVYGKFPSSAYGRFLNWLFHGLLNGGEDVRKHTKIELVFFKKEIEKLTRTSH